MHPHLNNVASPAARAGVRCGDVPGPRGGAQAESVILASYYDYDILFMRARAFPNHITRASYIAE